MAKKNESKAEPAKPKNLALWITLGVIAAIIILALLWFMGTYNSLVKADETVNNKWAQVEASYQRRLDLIPNLVATVQAAADFERNTYMAVTEARTKWLNAQASGGLNAKVESANQFESALARLLVTVEAYPDLKATQNFQALQDELANTENKINVERSRYNDAVTEFNKKTRTFPSNMVAGMFGFDQRIYFKSAEGAQSAPAVTFSV